MLSEGWKSISEILHFKILQESMPPDPASSSRLVIDPPSQ